MTSSPWSQQCLRDCEKTLWMTANRLRANFVMTNPPFNISEWWDATLEGDPR